MATKSVFLTITTPTNRPPTIFTETASWTTGATIVTATFSQVTPASTISYSIGAGNTLIYLTPGAVPGPSTPTPPSTTSVSTTSTPGPTTIAPGSTSSPLATSGPISTSGTTSSSTSSTNLSSPSATNHNAGVSKGAAAGIGIGCAAIGALLAALGVWLLLRRRRPYSRSPPARASRNVADEDSTLSKGYGKVGPAMALQSMPSSTVDRHLPQPLDDNTISREFSRLGTTIKNHAQTYYASEGDFSARADKSAIHRLLGFGSSMDAGTVADLLARASSRVGATRYLIAWAIIQRIDDDLLPPGVATCMKSMSGLAHDTKARAACLGRWRAISALLMHDNYGQAQLSPNDPRIQRANELATALDDVLHPFASNRYSHEERTDNLRSLIQRAVRYSYMLFSQPSSWDFDWTLSKEESGDQIVAFPALLQVTDEHGTIFPRPRRLVQKELANRR